MLEKVISHPLFLRNWGILGFFGISFFVGTQEGFDKLLVSAVVLFIPVVIYEIMIRLVLLAVKWIWKKAGMI